MHTRISIFSAMLWFMKDLLQLLSKDVESLEIYRKDQVSLKVRHVELQI